MATARQQARYEKLCTTIERTQRRFEKADKTAKRCLTSLAKLERQRRRLQKAMAKIETIAAVEAAAPLSPVMSVPVQPKPKRERKPKPASIPPAEAKALSAVNQVLGERMRAMGFRPSKKK